MTNKVYDFVKEMNENNRLSGCKPCKLIIKDKQLYCYDNNNNIIDAFFNVVDIECFLSKKSYYITNLSCLKGTDRLFGYIVLSHYMWSEIKKYLYMYGIKQGVDTLEIINVSNSKTIVKKTILLGKLIADFDSLAYIILQGNKIMVISEFYFYIGDNSQVCFAMLDYKNIKINNFITSDMTMFSSMFEKCSNLVNLNWSNVDMSKITSLDSMFLDCYNLKEVFIDKFDVCNVLYFRSIFRNCYNLESLSLLKDMNMSNIKDCSFMFYNCNKLQYCYIETWSVNWRNFGICDGMFDGCDKLVNKNKWKKEY